MRPIGPASPAASKGQAGLIKRPDAPKRVPGRLPSSGLLTRHRLIVTASRAVLSTVRHPRSFVSLGLMVLAAVALRLLDPPEPDELIRWDAANGEIEAIADPIPDPDLWPVGRIASDPLNGITEFIMIRDFYDFDYDENGEPFLSLVQSGAEAGIDVTGLGTVTWTNEILDDGLWLHTVFSDTSSTGITRQITYWSNPLGLLAPITGTKVRPKLTSDPGIAYPPRPSRAPIARTDGFIPAAARVKPPAVKAGPSVQVTRTVGRLRPPTVTPVRPVSPAVRPSSWPGPAPSRIVVPSLPRSVPLTSPQVVPAIKVRPEGAPEIVVAPAPVTTPVWQEVPWAGAQPIGEPAWRPRADLESMAREMGKQEQKLAQIGLKLETSTGSPLDLQPVMDLLQAIYDSVTGGDSEGEEISGTTYLFDPPFDTPGTGVAEAAAYEIPAAPIGEALAARLDSLADAIQLIAAWRVKLSKGNAPAANVTLTAHGTPDD